MTDVDPNREVVAVRRATCASDESIKHVTLVKLADETELSAADLVALIDAGRQYFMAAPSSMRLVDAAGQVVAGELPPLILQACDCPHCGARVPFA